MVKGLSDTLLMAAAHLTLTLTLPLENLLGLTQTEARGLRLLTVVLPKSK